MADMTVSVSDLRSAEEACRMLFGEDADRGPVMPAPDVLLKLKEVWPGHPEDVLDVALHLPIDFDIEREMAKDHRKAVVIRVNRVTILHDGRKVGYALRTDQAGVAGVRFYNETWDRLVRGLSFGR